MNRADNISAICAILNAGVVAAVAGLMDGTIPIPDEAKWVAPIIVAMLTALSPQLRKRV